MVRKPKITSLKELQQRKKELRLEAELTKRAFAHSIGTSRENVSSYLLKSVAAPVGGGVLVLFLANKLFSTGKQPKVVKETKVIHEYPDGRPYKLTKGRAIGTRRTKLKWVATLVSLGKLIVPMVQAIIGAVTTHQAKESAEDAEIAARRAARK